MSERAESAAAPSTLTDQLRANKPELQYLKLNRPPAIHFDDFARFCDALKQNTVVSSVRLTSQFLLNLADTDRIDLMKIIGALPALEELEVGAVRPACILTQALKISSKLRTLKFWKLSLSSNEDVSDLAYALGHCQFLQEVNLSDIRFTVQGQNRVNPQGKIYFQETDASKKEVSLDPLYDAMSSLPQLETIRIRQPLNESRIQPPTEKSLRSLCQSPRKVLSFHDCGLSDHQCSIIANELQSNDPPLSALFVTNNYPISSRGWDAFMDMLAVNYSITCFEHGAEGQVYAPTEDQLAKMSYYTHLNQHGRRKLLLSGSHGHARRAAWFDFLTRGKDNLDLVFFAMQADPSIYCNAN